MVSIARMPRLALHPSRAVADLLRTRRQELDLTLRDVQVQAAAAGDQIPFTTLAKVEQGKVDPGLKRLYRLLNLYHLPIQMVGDLLELEETANALPRERNPEILYREGVRLWKEGSIRPALGHLFALRHLIGRNPSERLARQKALVSFSIVASSLGKVQLARLIVDELLLEPPEPELLVSVLIQAALCWHWMGSGEAALAFLARAEDHLGAEEVRERAWVFHERASVFVDQGQFGRAEEALEQALAAYERCGDLYGAGRALGVRARLRLEQKDGNGALEAARTARADAARNGHSRLERLRRIDEARAHFLLGQWDAGLSHLSGALAESLSADDTVAQFYCHFHLWKAYLARGDAARSGLELHAAFHFEKFVDEITAETREIRALRIQESNGVRGSRRSRKDLS